MGSEICEPDGQDQQEANDEAQIWGRGLASSYSWRPAGQVTPPEGDAFPVDWQLSPGDDDAAPAKAASRDEEARMVQKRLLRLYRGDDFPPEEL